VAQATHHKDVFKRAEKELAGIPGAPRFTVHKWRSAWAAAW
jgi:hypothetical protein